MSRVRNEVRRLEGHVTSLRIALLLVSMLAAYGIYGMKTAPDSLNIHVPPDLRSGSSRMWWDIPPENIYAFTSYIFQQLNSWPADGAKDYKRNIHALQNYLTPACKVFLEGDYEFRNKNNELKGRVRGVYELPGRGYADDEALRVQQQSINDWIVNLDLATDEYYSSEPVKRTFVRYPIRVVRLDKDAEKNPWGLALDCYSSAPMRIATPDEQAATSTEVK
ncbi:MULTISPECIES: PFL_4703 family integrating conjugative element protein [Pseudomonadaceae]|uniref:PFL_4703 family integrating conjugative element protein n=1 Tax=Pseudomonadaceae TaxID=135621 RepID=UPI00052D7E79|nr:MULTISPECIES: TIGR03746 family integrating conjugative element protein [Pseudomonadaceae]CEG54639.1 putative membrane protein [Stutzerimonas xanthomarina]MDH0214552.1 TIGR03746 family integrating conjugative element protein [Stutzerimonas stutzeri]MDH0261887.1 TIGR03746 family integrating conjugative element protein [Stutzerimonas stutzeri]MDI9730256.1 TIGR03746 family integrating conjugative element protein [Stutzerimonas stutzeri]MDI9750277.1 TIGR03746 family integrating conjugative eleme